jgi:DNA-binding IclR family transcriptional regulator
MRLKVPWSGTLEIRSIKRAAAVLRCIVDKPEGMSPTGIVEITGLSKATVHRILHTLASDDLVRVEGGRYLPGHFLVALAADSDPFRDLKRVAADHLAALRNVTGETAALVVRRGTKRVTILVALAFHELKAAPDVGSAKPVHAGAAGKALLAFIDPEELEELLDGHKFARLAANTVTSHAQFMRDVHKVCQQGFAVSSEESVDGQAAIAAPITIDGNVVAVVNLSAPVVRASKRAVREWTPHVLATARAIAGAERSRAKASRLTQVSRRSRL